MSEHQRQSAERPAAERYYAQYAALGVGPGDSPEAALQEAINEGTAPELEADQHVESPHERGRHPGVGHLRVLLRAVFLNSSVTFLLQRRGNMQHWAANLKREGGRSSKR